VAPAVPADDLDELLQAAARSVTAAATATSPFRERDNLSP